MKGVTIAVAAPVKIVFFILHQPFGKPSTNMVNMIGRARYHFVFASAIAHTLNNTFVLLSEKFVLHIADKQNVSFVLFIICIGSAAVVSARLMCYEAQSIYKGYAEANVPSDYAPKKKNGAFRPIAEAFFTPTFLIVVIIFVVASITR